MTKSPDPNSRGYTNALLEDIDDKFQAVLEATQPIPSMQKTLNATFEEVGRLRLDVDALKDAVQDINSRLGRLESALQLLGRGTDEIHELKQRVAKLEQQLASR